MIKNNYDLVYLPSFYKELEEIVYYITYVLMNERAAQKLLSNVEKSILNRKKNPECFEIYQSKKYYWYRIYVGNFTIFYTIKDYVMIVSHIIFSRRNIDDLI